MSDNPTPADWKTLRFPVRPIGGGHRREEDGAPALSVEAADAADAPALPPPGLGRRRARPLAHPSAAQTPRSEGRGPAEVGQAQESEHEDESGEGEGSTSGGSTSGGSTSGGGGVMPPGGEAHALVEPLHTRPLGIWMCDAHGGSLVHLGLERRIDLRRFQTVSQLQTFISAVLRHPELDPHSLVDALTEAVWLFHQQDLGDFLVVHDPADPIQWVISPPSPAEVPEAAPAPKPRARQRKQAIDI